MSVQRHASEDVIINSPMSFAGAWQRSFRLRRFRVLPGPMLLSQVVTTYAAVQLVVVWWLAVVAWYVVFIGLLGLLFVPYRLLRRGARKRRAEALRHREVMAALEARGS